MEKMLLLERNEQPALGGERERQGEDVIIGKKRVTGIGLA